MRQFPTPGHLAAVDEQTALRSWEGLGYYRRVRSLQAIAREIVNKFGGRFPDNAEGLKRLPGIGPYTSGALLSFAFNKAAPIVDANVARVLARIDNYSVPVDSTEGQKYLWSRAESLVDPEHAREFNSAIMELGQTCCSISSPDCLLCPVRPFCSAERPETLPVKNPKPQVTRVEHHDILYIRGKSVLLAKCPGRQAPCRHVPLPPEGGRPHPFPAPCPETDLQHYPLQGDPLHPPCDGYASPQGRRGIRAAGQNPRAAHGISGPQGAELPRPGQTAGPYQMNDRLTPELVLSAYCQGCFPMADPETGEISFYEPDPRALIPLDNRFHIPHGLKRALNKKPFELRMDTAFPEVVHACARTEQPEEQWIDGQIEEAYGKLHEMGFAHSVECWDEEGLQGGLYGVALGKAFFGESMFHRKTDASKIALVALVQYLRAHQFLFLDTQWTTPHLLKFGTYEVPAEEYRKMLKRALAG